MDISIIIIVIIITTTIVVVVIVIIATTIRHFTNKIYLIYLLLRFLR